MFGRRRRVGGIVWLGALVALLGPSVARAQVDLLNQAQLQPGDMGEIGVRVEGVGLNNAARPGEWAGVRVRLVERGDAQREVLVRVSLTDNDGDDAQYEAVVTTNPNVEQPVWLYARMPFDIANATGFRVGVFAAEESPADPSTVGFIAGRLLGQTSFSWPPNITAATGLIGVVGLNPGGLPGYQQGSSREGNWLGHEWSQLIPLRPDALPDRWMGLAMLREIVWNGVSPAELRIEQVRALREWIERGGHLVVALPAVGQDWLAVSNQELAAMLPVVVVTRLEGEPRSSLRPLLTDEKPEDLVISDEPVTVHVFEPRAEAGPGEADCILADASGRCVVVSRSVGVGAVTLVGLPVWDRLLTSRGMPEADVFWHRVLGRRGQVATEAELAERKKSLDFDPQRRSLLRFDDDIPSLIAKSGRSLAGVMLGLVVFVVYWITAGPGGFALLKRRGWSRHAWMGFFGASIAFTALAWTGATLLRPKRVEVTHLSFLDHIYGQRIQRVRSWASVLVPVYGDATVSLESDDAGAGGSRFVQAVAPWEAARSSGGIVRGSFPDARSYAINARSPQSLTFPARATVKQVQLDWAGGLAWESIRPVAASGEDPFRAVKITSQPGARSVLEGKLVHGLPATLKDVRIVVFRGQIPVQGSPTAGSMLARWNAWALNPGEWEPGVALDLETVTPLGESIKEVSTLTDLLKSAGGDGAPSPTDWKKRFEWAAFFNLLDPPEYRTGGNNWEGPPLARREYTHGLDLSRWSTRPCLVVIGTLETQGEDSMPEPVRVATNGAERKVFASGTTVVRWVYPLTPEPPPVRLLDQGPASAEDGPAKPEGGS